MRISSACKTMALMACQNAGCFGSALWGPAMTHSTDHGESIARTGGSDRRATPRTFGSDQIRKRRSPSRADTTSSPCPSETLLELPAARGSLSYAGLTSSDRWSAIVVPNSFALESPFRTCQTSFTGKRSQIETVASVQVTRETQFYPHRSAAL
jgi:hypothetical protein